jgi:hypothetical protein
MATFRVDPETWAIAAADALTSPAAGQFASAEELAVVAASCPLSRLVAIWNALLGAVPVNRFTGRKTAVRRIWKALVPGEERDSGKRTGRGRRPKRPLARPSSKKARVIELLHQRGGASLTDIMAATGWQAHTVRAFISRTLVRQAQLKITSSRRPNGERIYHLKGR